MVTSSSNFYQLGASLPVDAQSYVRRLADEEFYQKLRAGKFCYVLNSRQMGKSSLRVQTMQRLQSEGTVCAALDLTGIGKYKVTLSQWYGGIVYGLVESCQLEDKFDFDWQTWWQKKQSILDPVTCLRLFIEEVLLEKIQQPIVIFVDEIDRVLSQDFSLDDFFALIRFFQNQRVDNPIFERLTFALLGVATPSDLITDKTQTPFNIGEGIELHGFSLEEAKPLIKGLEGNVSNPQQVMQEILDWTGGQPFLTQKLCQFMVEESLKDNPRSVGEVVRARIIENWESQDDPEHLRTIRDRILSHGQRASYLLELYQLLRHSGEITSNNSIEVSELQLSGLVIKRQEKLRVYNHIYQQIFDDNWIESQLKSLRPYSENFRVWVDSGGTDESRLLRGKALLEAIEWAQGKTLSYQDKQYLAASSEKEIQEKIAVEKQSAALERERKDKEAAESRNKMLKEANKKAQRRISIGVMVVITAVTGAVTVGLLSKRQLDETFEEVEAVKQLNKLAGELENQKSSNSGYNEALRLSALSFNIDNHSLKQALVFAAQSQAYQQLKKIKEAEQKIEKSETNLQMAEEGKKLKETDLLQIQVLFYKIQGSFLAQKNKPEQAIEADKKAFNILKKHPKETDFTKNQFITGGNITSIHRDLIQLLSKNNTESDLRKQVEQSLTKHLYTQLEDYLKNKKWQEADYQTSQLMLNIAKREEYLDENSIESFSCPDLRRIDNLWFNSDKRFGFRVQKEIWIRTGNRLGIKPDDFNNLDITNYLRFAKAVGWYDDKVRENGERSRGDAWVSSYKELLEGIKKNPKRRGTLPGFQPRDRASDATYSLPLLASDAYLFDPTFQKTSFFLALRLVKCNL
ncbi:MAG: AAA-like domain-containing protein [Rhizonema sp. PD37]|nr:AAA-like domain-containing protein [Rhizonema sp. PD37]